jgi:hypothetical protein
VAGPEPLLRFANDGASLARKAVQDDLKSSVRVLGDICFGGAIRELS